MSKLRYTATLLLSFIGVATAAQAQSQTALNEADYEFLNNFKNQHQIVPSEAVADLIDSSEFQNQVKQVVTQEELLMAIQSNKLEEFLERKGVMIQERTANDVECFVCKIKKNE